jgi:acyl-coenzyme A thioesterase PaaI-like protein
MPRIPRLHPHPFDDSILVSQSNFNTYEISAHGDHASGVALFGGSMYAIALKAVQIHFSTTLRSLNQPHTAYSQIEFLRPAVPGRLICTIENVKPGKQFTVTHISISQAGKKIMVGHATNTNLLRPSPKSLDIELPLESSPVLIDFGKVSKGTDPNWILYRRRYSTNVVLKSWTYLDKALPKNGPPDLRYTDNWIRPADPSSRIKNDWLGFIADSWVRMGENYVPGSPYSNVGMVATAKKQLDGGWYDREWNEEFDETYISSGYAGAYRWPTMSMGLEIRKILPEEGVEWLFVRAEAKLVKDGRTTTEVTIRDLSMDIIAISVQVGIIVPNPNAKL